MSDFIGEITIDLGEGDELKAREYKDGIDLKVTVGNIVAWARLPLPAARKLGRWLAAVEEAEDTEGIPEFPTIDRGLWVTDSAEPYTGAMSEDQG